MSRGDGNCFLYAVIVCIAIANGTAVATPEFVANLVTAPTALCALVTEYRKNRGKLTDIEEKESKNYVAVDDMFVRDTTSDYLKAHSVSLHITMFVVDDVEGEVASSGNNAAVRRTVVTPFTHDKESGDSGCVIKLTIANSKNAHYCSVLPTKNEHKSSPPSPYSTKIHTDAMQFRHRLNVQTA